MIEDMPDLDTFRAPHDNAKRVKIDQLIHEELQRPSSHSSHFDDSVDKTIKKQHEKQISDLFLENFRELLRKHGYSVPKSGNSKVASMETCHTKTSSQEPMDGDIQNLNLQNHFFVSGVKIGWPYPHVMQPQRQIAHHIISALKSSKHVVIESPTGTGKSAAILCSVLAWQRYRSKLVQASSSGTVAAIPSKLVVESPATLQQPCKIIYCSRTHSQVAQMVSSLRNTPYRPRMAILASRKHLCIHKKVSQSPSVNQECQVRVRNTNRLRKEMYLSQTQSYDEDHPPLPGHYDGNMDKDTTTSNPTGPFCRHYQQLGPKRTAVLACESFVPRPCGTKQGGAKSKYGTHDIEDLLGFGKDPYRNRGVAVYRSKDEPFGMTLVERNRRIHVAAIKSQGPAASSGSVRVGDEILSVNGQTVHPSVDEAARQVGQSSPNKPLVLDITSRSDLIMRDIDEGVSDQGACPYYLSRAIAKDAQIVFCPYNYVLDPFIRKTMDISIENAVIVLDEAHNIEDTLRDSGSGSFTEFEIAEMVKMLVHYASTKQCDPLDPDTKAIAKCAHELLLFIESIMLCLRQNKIIFEAQKASTVLQEWRRDGTPDEKTFEMSYDGPGASGNGKGCAPFFEKLEEKFDGDMLRRNCEIMETYFRTLENIEKDAYSGTMDSLSKLLMILWYADKHSEHYYIATMIRGNGSLQFAWDKLTNVDSSSFVKEKAHALPLLHYRRERNNLQVMTNICLDEKCRTRQTRPNFVDDIVRHGAYCNGTVPPWESCLIVELLSPAPLFKDLRTECRSIILASGSLAPIPSLCAELGLEGETTDIHQLKPTTLTTEGVTESGDSVAEAEAIPTVRDSPASPWLKPDGPRLQIAPKPLEADHIIDLEKQLLAVSCGVFRDGSLLTVNHSNLKRDLFIDNLGDVIATVIEAIPSGGVLVFLPSYSCLRLCVSRWKLRPTQRSSKKTCTQSTIWERLEASKGKVIEEPTGSQRQFELARDEFASTVAQLGSCVLLAVFRGKMSEGISFNDENARGVICVGIPYPNFCSLSIKAKKAYNDEQRNIRGNYKLLSGDDWYEQQAFRAIAQALGRCIRHAYDYGVIILMDSRHCDDGAPRRNELCRAHRRLPKWMRHYVKNLLLSNSGQIRSDSIHGGWAGLQKEMKLFFAEAQVYVQKVIDETASLAIKSRANCFESYQFDVNTGSWTGINEQQVQKRDEPLEAEAVPEFNSVTLRIVTPPERMTFTDVTHCSILDDIALS